LQKASTELKRRGKIDDDKLCNLSSVFNRVDLGLLFAAQKGSVGVSFGGKLPFLFADRRPEYRVYPDNHRDRFFGRSAYAEDYRQNGEKACG